MSDKPNLLTKVLQATEIQLDRMIAKAKVEIAQEEDDAYYRKSVYKDMDFSGNSSGYQEKQTRLNFYFLRQMASKDSIITAIIQTRQNQVSAFAKPVKQKYERGFNITLK